MSLNHDHLSYLIYLNTVLKMKNFVVVRNPYFGFEVGIMRECCLQILSALDTGLNIALNNENYD